MTRRLLALLCLLLLVIIPIGAAPASAQSAREAKLIVTVVDQTRAVIPGADITVNGLDEATKAKAVASAKTSDVGVATIGGLVPGRYSIKAEFPGFDAGELKEIRVRAGDNKHVVVLPVKGFQDSVTVGRDAQEAAGDRRNVSFGTALTREQVEALSDDPNEMMQQLQEIAGPGAVIRVDSFEGSRLPPKAMIKSIHVTRDAFAAENHSAGAFFIDIITQPGVGPKRGGVRYSLRDGALSGRSPFVQTKGPERTQNFGTNIAGAVIKDRSSFNLSLNGSRAFDTPILRAVLPTGTSSANLNLRSPRDNFFVYGSFDYAITKDQTLRISYNQNDQTDRNRGVGGYDLLERAYSTDEHFHNIRVQEAGPLGRRFFTNTRLSYEWSDASARSVVEAPTIRVLEAFTSGGAQIAGGRRVRTFNLASDLDYVRGIHSLRTGLQLIGGSYRSDDTSNYLGTYTFESVEAYQAGRPRGYTRRIGDPNVDYFNLQAGWYLQDDIRVRKGLTFSPGVRYEIQTHLSDRNAIGPRFGITWAPFKNGKTTLRASAGIFYDWLNSSTYEQTLRVDGFRQQELNIINPAYPDPGNVGIVPPINRYLLADDLQMARNTRLSAGVDYAITPKIRLGSTYAYIRGSEVMRGLNLNAPVGGVRPDPRFGNIVEVVSDGASRQHTLNTFLNVSLSPPSPNPSKQLWDWKRINFGANYFVGRNENNTDGAFGVPATGSLAEEWGPAPFDIRQRFNVFMLIQSLRNFNFNAHVMAASAPPYTIRTGLDTNGDLIFNDRPAGVGRNSVRGSGTFNTFLNCIYTIGVGSRKVQLPPGIFINGTPAGLNVQTMNIDPLPRFRIGIFLNAQNITNHRNYVGYTGTQTSLLFGQPTSVQGMRKIDVGVNFNF